MVKPREQDDGGHAQRSGLSFLQKGFVYVVAMVQCPKPLATTSRGLWVSQKRGLGQDVCALGTLDVDADRAEHVDGSVPRKLMPC